MNPTIHVELMCPRDAADLVEFLGTRGLASIVTNTGDHSEIEVSDAVDAEVRLRHEFESALAAWLEESGRPLIPAADREHDYVLRTPGD